MPRQLAAIAVALVLLAAGCSGEESAVDQPDAPENAPIEQIDEGGGGIADGEIDGLLIVQPSFGFGVYVLDGTTGLAQAVPGIASVETVDRDNGLFVSNGAAYSLGAKVREGQVLASDISIVKVNYATGVVSQLAALGFDRETDDSEAFTRFEIEAVAGDNVVVSSELLGSSIRIFEIYNGASGDKVGSFEAPTFDVQSENASCSGDVLYPVGLPDGRLVAAAGTLPALVDLDDGDVELMVECGERLQLSDFATSDELANYGVFAEGPAPTDADIAALLQQAIGPRAGMIEGGGDLWWLVANPRTVGEVNAIIGGLVRFDIDTAQVEAVYSLGDRLGEYGDEITTIAGAQMRYVDGQLYVLDQRDNGQLLVVDTADGSLRPTQLERGDGVDYTSADLLPGDPDAVWLEVRRMTITSEDEAAGTRSASGPIYIERFDPVTGQIDLSLLAEDVFF